jgi:hypothetical protein
MNGKVGYIQRNSSGKIKRSEPLALRGADGVREYYDQTGDKVSYRVASLSCILYLIEKYSHRDVKRLKSVKFQ